MWKERKEREECMLRNGGLLLEKRISYFGGKYSNAIRSFSAKELQQATDNYIEDVRFDPWVKDLSIDNGVAFNWYRGCLEGRVIFVKKYVGYSIATHNEVDFNWYIDPLYPSRSFCDPEKVANEIAVAAQLSGHKNALKLLGCCLETQIPTLVFEFPMNGNLKHQLAFNPTCLSWKSRLKIANEIASVIMYLHTAFPRPIIHRDIHAGHFYLDQDLCAKLSDFLFSIPLPEGKTQVEDEDTCGIKGYLAPEVLSRGVYSEKTDVFYFGLLLFNLLRREGYFEILLSITDYLKDPMQSFTRNHGINEIVDPTILAEGGGVHHHHQFRAVFQLILKCCRWNAEERPIMLDVAKQLRRIQRGDFILDGAIDSDTFSSYNIGLTRLLCHRKALE